MTTFTTLNKTTARGINDAGQIVGNPGFLYSGGTYSDVAVPASGYNYPTNAFGINNSGQIVGSYNTSLPFWTYGFLLSGGTYTQLSYPGNSGGGQYGNNTTIASDINDSGQIVGTFYSRY